MDSNELQSNLANIRSLVERINQLETAETKPGASEEEEARRAAAAVGDQPPQGGEAAPKPGKEADEDEDEEAEKTRLAKAKKEAEDAEDEAEDAEAKAKKALAIAKRKRAAAAAKKAVVVSTPSDAGTASDTAEDKIDVDSESNARDLAGAETKAVLTQIGKALEVLAKKISAFDTFKSEMQEAIGITDTVLTQKTQDAQAERVRKAAVNTGDSMAVVKALIEQVVNKSATPPAGGEPTQDDVDPRFRRNKSVQGLSMDLANAFTDEALARRQRNG